MSSAFGCDLCGVLESGDPISKVTVTGANTSEDWCVNCFTSYQDWRAERKPTPTPDPDAPVIDPPMQGRP